MQPLAIAALSSGVVMILGVAATLIRTRHDITSPHVMTNRWNRHGSMPLAAGGLVLGAISRAGGQSPATHDTVYATAVTLFVAALLCALIGAAAASRQSHSSGPA